MAENVKSVSAVHGENFWKIAKSVIYQAGKYSYGVKLMLNLSDESTKWKVQDVLSKYYKGDINRLEQSIRSHKEKYNSSIKQLNHYSIRLGLPVVTKPETLLQMLMEQERRSFYSRTINKCLKKRTVMSMQAIERKYEGSSL